MRINAESIRSDGSLENDHLSAQKSEETVHPTVGRTPEEGHPSWGPRIRARPECRERAKVHGPNEGATPEKQDFSGCGQPQPGLRVDPFVSLTL